MRHDTLRRAYIQVLDSIAISLLGHGLVLHRNILVSGSARAIAVGVDFVFLGFDGVPIQEVIKIWTVSLS